MKNKLKMLNKPAVIFILAVALFSSCSKETKLRKSIVGTWDLTDMSEYIYDDQGALASSQFESDFTTYRYEFLDDGTGTYKGADASGSWEIPLTWSHSYSSSGNEKLTITTDLFGPDTREYTVIAHDRNTEIRMTLNGSYLTDFTIDGTYTFEKQ